MEAEVIYYCEDYENVNFAALSEYFGKPEDVANDFLSEIGINSVSGSHKRKQFIQLAVIMLLFSVVLVFVATEIYANYKQQKALDGHFIESITYEGDIASYATIPVYLTETFESSTDLEE